MRVFTHSADVFEGLTRIGMNRIAPGEGLPTTDRDIHIFRLELSE